MDACLRRHDKSFLTNRRKSNMFEGKQEGVKISFTIPAADIEYGALLGAGGFGEVYKGRWKHSLNDVAIKKIKGQVGLDAVAEFKREGEMMAQINSPYIVRLFGICTEPNKYAIVM